MSTPQTDKWLLSLGPDPFTAGVNVDQALEQLRAAHEGGRGFALFSAMLLCSGLRLPVPAWAAEALQRGWAVFRSLEVDTLGDAFGVPSVPREVRAEVEEARTRMTFEVLRARGLGKAEAYRIVGRDRHRSPDAIRRRLRHRPRS